MSIKSWREEFVECDVGSFVRGGGFAFSAFGEPLYRGFGSGVAKLCGFGADDGVHETACFLEGRACFSFYC